MSKTGTSPHKTGVIVEAAALLCMVKSGFRVHQPVGNIHRYDFVIDRGNGFERVQVKSGRIRNGAIRFRVASQHRTRDGYVFRPYHGEIELFGVYCQDNHSFYLIPVSEVGGAQAALRVDPLNTNQRRGIRWASDYFVAKLP